MSDQMDCVELAGTKSQEVAVAVATPVAVAVDISELARNAPPEQSYMMNLVETVEYDGKTFSRHNPNCTESLKLCVLPCFPWVKYFAGDDELTYSNDCICLCCPWQVKHGDTKVGSTESPGCCDNGAMFCCCPCLTCTGSIDLQYFKTADGQNKYAIKRDLFCCWPCVASCACCGACGACCSDGFNFCSNRDHIVMREDIRAAGKGGAKVGNVWTVNRLELFGCCPYRVPVRYGIDLDAATDSTSADLALLGVLPLIYRGIPVPCRCCIIPPVPKLTGISCLDAGRHRDVFYTTQQEMLKTMGGAPAGTEMVR